VGEVDVRKQELKVEEEIGDRMPYTKKRYRSRAKWKKYKRLVRKLKKKRTVKNPYAVARVAVYGKKKLKKLKGGKR